MAINSLQLKKMFARDDAEFPSQEKIDLLTVVKAVKPNILIGCSTCPGSFTEEIVKRNGITRLSTDNFPPFEPHAPP
jgi:malic enzyme